MWRTLYLLLLMLLTFDFHRDRVTEAEPVRVNAALVSLDHDRNHRPETRVEPEGWDENSAELVGKWRNNGEALEPKWRDGDSIPLLPFSEISPYTSDKITSQEENPSFQRDAKYQRNNNNNPDNSVRSRKTELSSSDYEDYELTESNDGYRERDETLARKRNRGLTDQNSFERTSNRKKEPSEDLKDDKEATWYRKTFQERPNDYGYEISDEEYSKPKPRKRRPPQNYEFALSESSMKNKNLDDEKESSSESTKKATEPLPNAMELKSLLKMQQKEGLSLSEILQRRNLTLLDLLKGKTDAINALKMKDVEENENSNDEAGETLSGSLMKVSSTRRPQWMVDGYVTESSKKDVEIVVPMGTANLELRKDRTSARESSSSSSKNSEIYSGAETAATGKSISSNDEPARGETIVTTSTPIATNSMEVLQGDEAAAKSLNGFEIKTEDLEEDEIMEFSDFTDYKKGRGGGSPVWLMMKEEQKSPEGNSEALLQDKGSTLSIEKILSPTERSKSGNNGSVESTPGKEQDIPGEKLTDGEQRVILQNSAEDYGVFSEKEYQDDAPRFYDLEVSTEANGLVKESDGKISVVQEMKSGLDAASPDTNFTENEQSDWKNPIMENNSSRVLKNHQSNGAAEKNSYGDIIPEGEPEARAEIFELFASGSAGKRLERLLKSRNMSLEELIALRQRGSSRVHLAEVSRIKVQKSDDESRSNLKATPVSKGETEPSLGRAIANSDGNYNNGLHNYLSQTTENVGNLDSTSSSANAVQVEESTTEQLLSNLESETNNDDLKSNEREEIRESQRAVQIVDLLTTFGSLPFAKDMQRNFASERSDEQLEKLPAQSNNRGAVLAKTIGINDTGFVKEVAKQDPNSFNVQTEYNILGDDESNVEKGKTLSKVKPSIIASGAILGVTLVVFLAIFIVCKIQQKQKYRYRSTFSRAVFQGPVMAARKLSNSSSLSNVMVNVVATSTAKRPERNEIQEPTTDMDSKTDIDNDSLDANDSWETIPDYMK